jgi:ABC-type sugar transport system substrate-binding protein
LKEKKKMKFSKVAAITFAFVFCFACLFVAAPTVEAGGGGGRGQTVAPGAPTQEAMAALPRANRPYRVVYTMFNGQNPVAREIEGGFIEAARLSGVDLWVMDNRLDPVQMNANVDMAIAAGNVDFYVLYTNDIAANPQLMDKLVAANIPVLTIATTARAANGREAPLIFGMEDNYNGAFLAAEALAQAARAKGWRGEDIVFVSMGFLEAGGVFIERTRGAQEGMRSVFPNLHDYIETSSTGRAEVAFQRMTDIMMTLPRDKKVLGWTHSDDVTASLLSAITNAGRLNDALLVSGGLSMQMLDMLREDNIMIGSIDQNWALFGPTILTHAINFLNNGTPIPAFIPAPYELLTPATVNAKYPRN